MSVIFSEIKRNSKFSEVFPMVVVIKITTHKSVKHTFRLDDKFLWNKEILTIFTISILLVLYIENSIKKHLSFSEKKSVSKLINFFASKKFQNFILINFKFIYYK